MTANGAPAKLFGVIGTRHHFSQQEQAQFRSKRHEVCTGNTLENSSLHRCEQFAKQGRSQGPCTLALRASQSCEYKVLIDRVIIVFAMERERERAFWYHHYWGPAFFKPTATFPLRLRSTCDSCLMVRLVRGRKKSV